MDQLENRIGDINEYIQQLFGQEDEGFKEINRRCEQHQIPMIQVPSYVGKLIYLLTKLKSPKNVLEIGTLGGYSTISIAKALQDDASLTTIDINEKHVEIAQSNAKAMQMEHKITFLQGDALTVLQQLKNSQTTQFDMVFIDADKENYLNYFLMVKHMIQKGALILSDNLIPKWKRIGEPHQNDQMAKAIYAFNEALSFDQDFESAMITTIVGKTPRIDGLGISIFKGIDSI